MKIVIIGEGSAGSATAVELRKQNKDAEIVILESSAHTLYSRCAMPYVLTGEVNNIASLQVLSEDDYKKNKIDIILEAHAERIDTEKRKVIFAKDSDSKKSIEYDVLVIATGACIRNLSIGDRVFEFRSLDDLHKVIKITRKKELSIVVIGAGFIGCELAVGLCARNCNVDLIEAQNSVMGTVIDNELAAIVSKHLMSKKVNILTSTVTKISAKKEKIRLDLIDNETKKSKGLKEYDYAIISFGAKPNSKLAIDAGIKANQATGAIIVDDSLMTSQKGIFALGDCIESRSFITKKPIQSMFGSTALKQAKFLARVILGADEKFPYALRTHVSKIGDLIIAGTGMTDNEAISEGINIVSATVTAKDKSSNMSDAKDITVKITADMKGRVIGAQIIGYRGVAERANTLAIAITKKMTLRELSLAETAYCPSVTPILDPVTLAAEICEKKRKVKR